MKNRIIKLTLSLLIVLQAVACKDSFFDQTPYDSLPLSAAVSTETDMGVAVNGMYAGLRSRYLYGRTFPFMSDLLADNVYLAPVNSGRYIPQNNYTTNSQNTDIRDNFRQSYAVIAYANNIINSPLVSENASATVNQYVGEALTVRALTYFNLVRFYGKAYTTDPAALGVPLVLKFDPKLKPSRNTVSEVYTQMIDDLTKAFSLMTVTTKNSEYVSKYVAEALLAKVFLYKGDYANAQASALDVVKNGGYTVVAATAFAAYWKNPAAVTNKVETIFEISADGVNNVGFDALANMYDQNGYGDGLCSTPLYNLYTATDVRKALITSGTKGLIIGKYQNVSNNADKDDLKVMRYSDLLLVLAEAYNRNGDNTNALLYLNQVIKQRDPSFAGYTSSGAVLLNDIITERRKELAFEGDRFNDLNRLGLDINRSTQYPATALLISSGDPKRLMPIPQVEMDANSNMTQNDGY
jgi:hypothetical protein